MSTIIIKNNHNQAYDLTDLFSYHVVASGIVTLSDYFDSYEIARSTDLAIKVAEGTFTVNNGIDDLTPIAGVNHCLGKNIDVNITSSSTSLGVDILGEYRDRSGKLRVHQTSRKLGTMILWTGEGDNPNVPDSIGGGERLAINYVAGGSEPLVKYIDFNCTSTETWIHEGYITWYGALLDTLDLQIVNRVTSTASGIGTNYNLYGGYLVVPAVPGTGTLRVTSDITTSTGGLIYMPLNDLGVRTPSFWNADWNPSVKRFENITAAPNGDGEYNMFATELVLSQVIRSMNLIDRGFIAMSSSDVDELGNGMRLRFTADINTSIRDHDLLVACTLCLHRSRSVTNGVFV